MTFIIIITENAFETPLRDELVLNFVIHPQGCQYHQVYPMFTTHVAATPTERHLLVPVDILLRQVLGKRRVHCTRIAR